MIKSDATVAICRKLLTICKNSIKTAKEIHYDKTLQSISLLLNTIQHVKIYDSFDYLTDLKPLIDFVYERTLDTKEGD